MLRHRRSRHPRLRPLGAAGRAAVMLGVIAVTGVAPAMATVTPTPTAPGTGTRPTATPKTPATPTLPTPKNTVLPADSIGGPALASMGVITDLPPGVPAPPVLQDVSWLVADMTTGEIIAAKAPHAALRPASTLKTLTALTLIPSINASASYTATTADTAADGTRIGLEIGLKYTGTQLFQALLMGSANDAAYALARINGGMPTTLQQMNANAADLGAHDTIAKDPAGLDAPGQLSSAYDLALIARAAMKLPEFRRYVSTKTVAFPGKRVPTVKAKKAPSTPQAIASTPPGKPMVDAAGIARQTYALSNHNSLLYNYPGTIGVKNGYTTLANRTYIGAVSRGGKTYLVTEMHGIGPSSWRPTAAMFDWAFAHGATAHPIGRLVDPGEVPVKPSSTASATPAMTASTDDAPTDAATPTRAPSNVSAAGVALTHTTSPAPTAIGAGALAAGVLLGAWALMRRRRVGRHATRS